ncbi:unnamed protein product [Vicia faba]|uniref:Transmembrane protein n=1 Tax=Vicia faba TaxID=3906 RepID=A0AAV0YUX6_VICFA|nr:unnamed protein product [Vicia faba]
MEDLARTRSSFTRNHQVTINVVGVHVYNNIMGVKLETNPLHGLVTFMFFVLLAFLQISYPNNPTAFQLHPKTMLVSIASFLLYCMGYWINLQFATRLDTFMEVFASLSIVSLLLMFFPDNWEFSGFIIMYTLWFISHVFVMIIRLRLQMRRGLRQLLPTTSIGLN